MKLSHILVHEWRKLGQARVFLLNSWSAYKPIAWSAQPLTLNGEEPNRTDKSEVKNKHQLSSSHLTSAP